MPTIPNAPNGENTSLAGTEKVPLTGSKFSLISTIRDYILTFVSSQTLTDQATITWDVNSGRFATVTLAASRNLAAPTNQKAGIRYALKVIQNGTGGWALTYDSVYKNTPQPTTTAGAISILYFVSDGTNMYYVGGKSSGSPLTTKGDLFTYSTTDDRLGAGADYLFPGWLASEAIGVKAMPGGALLASALTNVASLNTSVTETDMISVSVPGATLYSSGNKRCLYALLHVRIFNNSGAGRQPTIRVYLGATKLFEVALNADTAGATNYREALIEVLISPEDSASAQMAFAWLHQSGALAHGTGVSTAWNANTFGHNVATEDTSSAKTFRISVQHDNAHASLITRVRQAFVRVGVVF